MERGYGIIPLKHLQGHYEVLLVQRPKGFWEFPKGHAEAGEADLDAAARELKEETGLSVVRYLDEHPLSLHYVYEKENRSIPKRVDYYMAFVEGEVCLQEGETVAYCWLSLNEAKKRLTFENARMVFEACVNYLGGINEK